MHEQPHPCVTERYDAVLLVSFGGPEAPDEVMPFLRRVTAGRGIPDERLAVVAEHYHAHGGRSPINDQCRALVAALTQELAGRGFSLPVLWGNRNSEPFLADVLADARSRGLHRLVAVTTSAYPSYSSCRQYREDLGGSVPEGIEVDRIAHYALTPGFIEVMSVAVAEALAELEQDPHAGAGGAARVLFVTHSIPTAMAETAGPASRPAEGSYVAWHREVAAQVMGRLAAAQGVTTAQGEDHPYEVVYCSRSGPASQPWLEPDVNDRIAELAEAGDRRPIVLAPIGFVSDHMEVINDLDVEAVQTAREHGVPVVRAATAGTAPGFVSQLVDQVVRRAEQAESVTAERAVTGPGWSLCDPDCCVNLRRRDTPVVV